MSKLRFIDDNLVDETGKIYEVNKEDLINACGDSNYSTLSVAGIICEKVAQITRCEICNYACRQSKLFQTLEKIVVENEAYQQMKTERLKKAEEIRKNRRISMLSKKPPIVYCEKRERMLYRYQYKRRVSFD